MIIALEIEAHLEDLGLGASLIASTVDSALAILDVRAVDFAILDMNLGAETSDDIAIALEAKGVPFMFLTGYGENTAITRRFNGAPIVAKPFSLTSLRRALEQIGIN